MSPSRAGSSHSMSWRSFSSARDIFPSARKFYFSSKNLKIVIFCHSDFFSYFLCTFYCSKQYLFFSLNDWFLGSEIGKSKKKKKFLASKAIHKKNRQLGFSSQNEMSYLCLAWLRTFIARLGSVWLTSENSSSNSSLVVTQYVFDFIIFLTQSIATYFNRIIND